LTTSNNYIIIIEEVVMENVKELAKRYLGVSGQIDVETLLEEGKLTFAQAYVLGAIHRVWEDRQIDAEEFKEAIEKLGLTPSQIEAFSSPSASRITRAE
jgi:hypothetical protein